MSFLKGKKIIRNTNLTYNVKEEKNATTNSFKQIKQKHSLYVIGKSCTILFYFGFVTHNISKKKKNLKILFLLHMCTIMNFSIPLGNGLIIRKKLQSKKM